ncbi:MAG: ATP-binding protein [Deltaproteobacteria bacterium]|nr:ATP-binding protein [Deltaproteobacteria bacterium]
MSFGAALVLIVKRILTWPVICGFRSGDLAPGLQNKSQRWPEIIGAALGGGLWSMLGAFCVFELFGLQGYPSAVLCVPVVSGIAVAVAVAIAGTGAGGLAGGVAGAITGGVVVAVAIRGKFAFGFASTFTVAFGVAVAIAGAGAGVFAIAGVFAVAFGFAVAGAFGFAGARDNVLLTGYMFCMFIYFLGLAASSHLLRSAAEKYRLFSLYQSEVGREGKLIFLWMGALLCATILFAFPEITKKPEVVRLEPPFSFLSLVAAALATGLPLYPLLAVVQKLQCRAARARQFNVEDWRRFACVMYQTFAYPLPGIGQYIVDVAHRHGVTAALSVVQSLQRLSMQTIVTRRALFQLAQDKRVGFAFSAHVAKETNSATLTSLSIRSIPAASLSVLSGKEFDDPVQLYLPRLVSKTSFSGRFIKQRAMRYDAVLGASKKSLLHRIKWISTELEQCGEYSDAPEFVSWLAAARTHLQFAAVHEYIAVADEAELRETEWLAPGGRILEHIETALKQLENYRLAQSFDARREVLRNIVVRIKKLQVNELPSIWQNVATELQRHWVQLLNAEMENAREWLNLDVEIDRPRLRTGRGMLQVTVANPTGTVAQQLSIAMTPTPGIHWGATSFQERLLEGGRKIPFQVPLTCDAAGIYKVEGQLNASDLSDVPFNKSFSFQIHVCKPGTPYAYLPASTYPAGPLVSSDAVFAGRKDTLKWLQGIWGTSDSKEAAVLIGQRRIGKSSILNCIERRGLKGTNLIPVRLDVQGTNGVYAFLDEAVQQMSRALSTPTPVLEKEEPFQHFKRVFRDLKEPMGDRRILLMLDEADLLEDRVGSGALGLLRSLMQDPSYPLVLLFCGTHLLRTMSRDYQSILFNTAREKTVSYMSKEESFEVLRRPVGDALDYDESALNEAYKLTAGQPYLLQLLGGRILENLNDQLDDGKTPDNYVSLQDMMHAGDTVGKQDNPAFLQHWTDRPPHQQRVLCAMASVPESIRIGRQISDIEKRLNDLRMPVPKKHLVTALETLAEEEFLRRRDGQYEFFVPLFHRWVAARQKPEIVRELTTPDELEEG